MQTSTVRHPHPPGESVVAALLFAIVDRRRRRDRERRHELAGWTGTTPSRSPAFTPPEATFGIVWTILYVAIAVAGWLAWRASDGTRPTIWWAMQMALNLLWTAVFFGLESPVGGVVVIVPAAGGRRDGPARCRHRVDTTAAVLLFPYLVWCGFAAALTVGVAVLN